MSLIECHNVILQHKKVTQEQQKVKCAYNKNQQQHEKACT